MEKTMACLINSMLEPQWLHLSRRGNGRNSQELLCWLATAQDWVMSVDLDRQRKHITQSLQRHLGLWDYKTAHLACAKCALGGKDGGGAREVESKVSRAGGRPSGQCHWRWTVGSLKAIVSACPMQPRALQEQAGEEPSTTWRWQRKRLDGFGWKEMTSGGQ